MNIDNIMFKQLPNGNVDLSFLKRRRELLGLTQKKLAVMSGISQSMLTKIERNEVSPSINVAMALLRTLEYAEHAAEKSAGDVMHSPVIALKPDDTVREASILAKKQAISQFPVVDNGRLIGSIRTSDIIGARKAEPISRYIGENIPTISQETPISVVTAIVKRSNAVLVLKNGNILGIITAEDLL